jgi:hypothetical protein
MAISQKKIHHNVTKVFEFVAMTFFLSFFLCQDGVKICQYRYTYIALTWYVGYIDCNLPTKMYLTYQVRLKINQRETT